MPEIINTFLFLFLWLIPVNFSYSQSIQPTTIPSETKTNVIPTFYFFNQPQIKSNESDRQGKPVSFDEKFINKIRSLTGKDGKIPKSLMEENVIPHEGQTIWLCSNEKHSAYTYVCSQSKVKGIYLDASNNASFRTGSTKTTSNFPPEDNLVYITFPEGSKPVLEVVEARPIKPQEVEDLLQRCATILNPGSSQEITKDIFDELKNEYGIYNSAVLGNSDIKVVTLVALKYFRESGDNGFDMPNGLQGQYCLINDGKKVFIKKNESFLTLMKINSDYYFALQSYDKADLYRSIWTLKANNLDEVFSDSMSTDD